VSASLPPRLARLPRVGDAAGRDVRLADSFRARLLGLALLPEIPPGVGLLLPGTRAVHTFGMRFALELRWLDGDGGVLRVDRRVAPRRVASCRPAAAVLELSSARR
jgi:uncharacterized membrane protein (UPF0127 family)